MLSITTAIGSSEWALIFLFAAICASVLLTGTKGSWSSNDQDMKEDKEVL